MFPNYIIPGPSYDNVPLFIILYYTILYYIYFKYTYCSRLDLLM